MTRRFHGWRPTTRRGRNALFSLGLIVASHILGFVAAEAAHHGVGVSHAEIVGLVPLAAMLAVAKRSLRLEGFQEEQVLELRLAREGKQE